MINYIIITAVKNEEDYLNLTIDSVIKQTIKPTQWIIVDDGSEDSTKIIIENYTYKYNWIRGVYLNDKGHRKPGIRHIKAFYAGYNILNGKDWKFIVKLDGDVSFNNSYFEKCFERFYQNTKLGIGGGRVVNKIKDAIVEEKHPLFHVRGATKIYRRECWDAIGGILVSPAYDTLDEVKANMTGYETQTFQELTVIHHRKTGNANGKWKNSVKNGISDYLSGYHPLFFIIKCFARSIQKPFLIDALGHLYGFISGYLKQMPQITDRKLVAYMRKQQIRRLIFKDTIWK